MTPSREVAGRVTARGVTVAWAVAFRFALALAFVVAFATAVGCSRAQPERPEAVLNEWVNAMQASRLDVSQRRHAFDLLAASSRAALAERAQRASQLSGRELAPWEMLAPGRFTLNFEFDLERATSILDGDHATVVVRSRTGDRADVPMVSEGGHWRVLLRLPPMQTIRAATDAGP